MRAFVLVLIIAAVLPAEEGRYTLRETGGRWTIVDPHGQAFFPLGLSHAEGVGPEEMRAAGFKIAAGAAFARMPLAAPMEEVFDAAGQDKLRGRVREACTAARSAPSLIGYVVANTSGWDAAGIAVVRRMGPDHAAKQQYVDFLKDKYAYNVGRLNEAYGLDSPSFTDLTASDFSALDARRAAVREDDAAFLGWVAEVFYRTAVEELRRCDPRRLVLGEPANPFADAVWLETGHRPERLLLTAGKPVVVSDHRPGEAFSRPGEAEAQAGRGAGLQSAEIKSTPTAGADVLALPYVVGYVRCARAGDWRRLGARIAATRGPE